MPKRRFPFWLAALLVGVGLLARAFVAHGWRAPTSGWQWDLLLETYGGALSLLVGLILWLVQRRDNATPAPLAPPSPTVRQALIAAVRDRWVHDLLADQFLGYELRRPREVWRSVYLPLDMAWASDQVASPRARYRAPTASGLAPLPPGASLLEAFDEAGGSLLILGQPGAGKTVALAKLIEALLERAQRDANAPVPVGLFLRSWADAQAGAPGAGGADRLQAWMIARLAAEYRMGREAARQWVAGGLITPLLDGLDELPEEAQADCARAINAYQPAGGLRTLAAACRQEDYARLGSSVRLELNDAVLLQPYRPEQATQYLREMERGHPSLSLDGVRALCADADCAPLARNPLMLWAMCQTPAAQLPQPAAPAIFMPALWERYVATRYQGRRYAEQMRQAAQGPQAALARLWARVWRKRPYLYPQEIVDRSLAWAARMMSDHAQQPFYLEDLQPDWLETPRLRRRYAEAAGVAGGAAACTAGSVAFGVATAMSFDTAVGVAFGAIVSVVFGAAVGVVFGATIGIRQFLAGRRVPYGVRLAPPEQRRWAPSWRNVAVGVAVGAAVAATAVAITLVHGAAIGVAGGVALALYTIYAYGLRESVAPEARRTPNQGLRAALRQGVIASLWAAFLFAAPFALMRALGWPLLLRWMLPGPAMASALNAVEQGLLQAIVAFGASGLLCGGLFSGWDFVLYHLALRYVLWRASYIPAWFADLLEQAASLGLLNRVGGGYRFVHPTLQEWYAARWPAPRPPAARSSSAMG